MDFLQQGLQEWWVVFDTHILLYIPLSVLVALATLSVFFWCLIKTSGIPADEFSELRMLYKVTLWLTPPVAIYTYFVWTHLPK